jgi:hypothetical protein
MTHLLIIRVCISLISFNSFLKGNASRKVNTEQDSLYILYEEDETKNQFIHQSPRHEVIRVGRYVKHYKTN